MKLHICILVIITMIIIPQITAIGVYCDDVHLIEVLNIRNITNSTNYEITCITNIKYTFKLIINETNLNDIVNGYIPLYTCCCNIYSLEPIYQSFNSYIILLSSLLCIFFVLPTILLTILYSHKCFLKHSNLIDFIRERWSSPNSDASNVIFEDL